MTLLKLYFSAIDIFQTRNETQFASCKGIRMPGNLLLESGIWENFSRGIQNPGI